MLTDFVMTGNEVESNSPLSRRVSDEEFEWKTLLPLSSTSMYSPLSRKNEETGCVRTVTMEVTLLNRNVIRICRFESMEGKEVEGSFVGIDNPKRSDFKEFIDWMNEV